MPHVVSKCLGQTDEQIETQREESNFHSILHFWKTARNVIVKISGQNILIMCGFFDLLLFLTFRKKMSYLMS